MSEITIIEKDTDFENWMTMQTKKFIEVSKPQSAVNKIYHYTDINGLFGILEKQCLWASNINFINDSTEYSYGISIYNRVYEGIQSQLKDEKIKEFLHNQKININAEQTKTYSISFCENKDLLSQWRGYCNGNIGFSIGLTNENFQGALECKDIAISSILPRHISYKKVLYEVQMIEKLIEDWIICFHDFFQIRIEELNTNERSWQRAWGTLVNQLPLFKNPSFNEEKEWRIVLYEPLISMYNKFTEFEYKLPSIVKFRTRNDIILPYIELQSNNDSHKKLPIKEIVIGPAPTEKQQYIKNNLLFYLEKNDLPDIIVTTSEIPYRE